MDNLIGHKFGMLTVTGDRRGYKQNLTLAVCRCDCGRQYVTRFDYLRKGISISCGCIKRSVVALAGYPQLKWQHSRKPDGRSTPEYNSWSAMRGRCINPKHPSWPDYGGRGIAIYPEWLNFDIFLKDMGPRPPGTTLDRIDHNGDYRPGNCQWADKGIQANNKRSCVFLEHDGKRMTMKQWSELTGIKYKVLHQRIHQLGWSPKNALTIPVKRSTQF